MVCFNLATFGGVVVFVTLLWPAGRWTVARACPVRCNCCQCDAEEFDVTLRRVSNKNVSHQNSFPSFYPRLLQNCQTMPALNTPRYNKCKIGPTRSVRHSLKLKQWGLSSHIAGALATDILFDRTGNLKRVPGPDLQCCCRQS